MATGTAFDLPMLIQVERLSKERQPDSEDVDLEKLWGLRNRIRLCRWAMAIG